MYHGRLGRWDLRALFGLTLFLAGALLFVVEPMFAKMVLPKLGGTPAVWNWLEAHVAGNGPIRRLLPVNVRQSMANGGGPACLRLRVVADPGAVDPRFIADEAKLDRIAGVVAQHWPEAIAPGDLASAALASDVRKARSALLAELGLSELD